MEVSAGRIIAKNGGRWPSKDTVTGRWHLFSVDMEVIRSGAVRITVKDGFMVVFTDYVEPQYLDGMLKSLKPADTTEAWKEYLDEAATTGQEPLNIFPHPPLLTRPYKVALRSHNNAVYLANSLNSVDVQHYLQCYETEHGLKVSDQMAKSFVIQDGIFSVDIRVPSRLSTQNCANWYRRLRLNLYGASPIIQATKTHPRSTTYPETCYLQSAAA